MWVDEDKQSMLQLSLVWIQRILSAYECTFINPWWRFSSDFNWRLGCFPFFVFFFCMIVKDSIVYISFDIHIEYNTWPLMFQGAPTDWFQCNVNTDKFPIENHSLTFCYD